jgi:hypothetical protein
MWRKQNRHLDEAAGVRVHDGQDALEVDFALKKKKKKNRVKLKDSL